MLPAKSNNQTLTWDMRIFEILEIGARFFPNNRAVVHGKRQISYRQLLRASERFADHLRALSLAGDSRVAILYENSVEYVILFFGILKAGYIAVPVDTSLRPDKINYILADCKAEVLIFQSKFRRNLEKIIASDSAIKFLISDREPDISLPNISTEVLSKILDGPHSEIADSEPMASRSIDSFSLPDLYARIPDSPKELVAIFYTSGSTGTPKGVMLSHRNLVSNTIATVDYLKLADHDRVLVILPFYYIYGNSLLLTHLLVGGTVVIDNRFLYPEVVLDTMEKEEVTGFSGVPSNFIILLNNSTMASRKLEHLRYFTQAGGAMAPEIIRKLMKAFPRKEIYIMYGQTEAAPRISYLPPHRLAEKVGSIGIPVPQVRIKVVNEDGLEVPAGESGELIVCGDNVMLGYWNQPEETEQVIKVGWLYTGDLARMDKDGYLYITGRKKEIIKTGGNRVSTKEIEECLLENEKIMEAAVFGVEDPLLGEAIKAVIALKKGYEADAREIQNYCKMRLADHKAPKYVEFMGSLPKSKSGKVNKLLLMNKE